MLSWEHGGGFSLDATVRVEAHDRKGLERLLRYCARPLFASERLRWEEAGERLIYLPPQTPAQWARHPLALECVNSFEKPFC